MAEDYKLNLTTNFRIHPFHAKSGKLLKLETFREFTPQLQAVKLIGAPAHQQSVKAGWLKPLLSRLDA